MDRCSLVCNTGTQSPVCVPPPAALNRPLSDADIRRIRELFGKFSRPGESTAALDAALTSLHAELRDYLNIRIRRHTSNAQPTSPGTGADMWHGIFAEITRELLNDMTGVQCPNCTEEIDNTGPSFLLECRFPAGRCRSRPSTNYTPMHSSLSFRPDVCPVCRRSMVTNHNRVQPSETLPDGGIVRRSQAPSSSQAGAHVVAWSTISKCDGERLVARRCSFFRGLLFVLGGAWAT